MKQLILKELSLCLHPTSLIFLSFAALVFVPNYPYEVIFFFSGLSVFFTCLTVRENGDLAFTAALPAPKGAIPLARMAVTMGFQILLLALVGALGALKAALLPAELLINEAGLSANWALVGSGALLLGAFNLLFFPRYFRRPDRVGGPFAAAAAVLFLLIGLLIALRWTLPLFSVTLNGSNAEHTGAKLIAMAAGLVLYAGLSALACLLSVRRFLKTDL